MAIHWYPVHMHKAQKEIRQIMPKVDLVIEVLDARIPFSSENPMVAELRGDKPCIKVLSKSDLADPLVTAQWQTYLEQEKGVKAIALTTDDPARSRQLTQVAKTMFPHRDKVYSTITTMIVGIPNVGKSTLINILAGRHLAKTGNEPAVTKGQQRINLDDGIVLFDTPGILWPKVENEKSSYRLAASGAIRDTAMEYDDVAFFAADYLLKTYPELLMARYELEQLPATELELLEVVGHKRGCLRTRGKVDLNKVSELLIHELRAGQIGRISLETPAQIEQEKLDLEEKKRLKAEQDALRKARFKAGKRPDPEPALTPPAAPKARSKTGGSKPATARKSLGGKKNGPPQLPAKPKKR
jgi:ribosome biogenesis GTPase A